MIKLNSPISAGLFFPKEQLKDSDRNYFAKSSFPLSNSQTKFDLIWRMCESYELWCRETKQSKLIKLNIID